MKDDGKEDDEVEEVKKEKGEERDLLLEEVIFGGTPLSFEALLKIIPKLDKGIRIKVFSSEGKFIPLTKTGNELANGYKMVGFSFIPVMVVDKPIGKVEAPQVKSKSYIELERVWRDLNVAPQPLPPLNTTTRGRFAVGGVQTGRLRMRPERATPQWFVPGANIGNLEPWIPVEEDEGDM